MDVLGRLAGGDRRSIGRADEVVGEVLAEPALFDAVFGGMEGDDPLIRMRAADVIEKVSARRPEWLQPYKERMLRRIARSEQQEVRWHVAQMLPRLRLDAGERAEAVDILTGYLGDRSRIVQTFAMQALADLAATDASLRPVARALIAGCVAGGSPAVRGRGRKLLAALERPAAS